eukprot:CAMPEP_0171216006 /NCGR_PEP_ID=MMETSP0790-20130122/31960_1 /TAXON_ID=2925 /ORGANISM="Alexandrium catenella, Strain OF101" /LENGTH=120 /DNA_ID=CAMNT_0011681777 /DNA_START=81 /DNA_END=443 /DNA_ORIENTATION=+
MSRPGTALQKLSKWLMPHCGGKQPLAASPAAGNPVKNDSVEAVRSKPSREENNPEKVPIDRETEVPVELYMLLVEAGKKARARGQHKKVPQPVQVRPSSGANRGNACSRAHLVRSNQATA